MACIYSNSVYFSIFQCRHAEIAALDLTEPFIRYRHKGLCRRDKGHWNWYFRWGNFFSSGGT